MARTETTQTPAIMRGLAGHLGKGRTRNHFQHHQDRDGGQGQDGEAGEDPRHATVVADFGVGLLRFEVHGGRYYAGSARLPGARLPTVKPVAFGDCFCGGGVRQCTAESDLA